MSLPTPAMDRVIELARQAGAATMEVYAGEAHAREKADRSPVTEADLRSHRLLCAGLADLTPEIPILSEESSEQAPYEVRRNWEQFWLVDPLDGTKEFLKHNGQFTVNIALIRGTRPVAGVVYAPATGLLYYSTVEGKAYKSASGAPAMHLAPRRPVEGDELVVVGSLSHPSPEMESFLAEQKRRFQEVRFVAMGSSLKICLIADGGADIYPRFGPTMEWDTAAAHAIANAAGCRLLRHNSAEELVYNKENLLNPWFLVEPRPA